MKKSIFITVFSIIFFSTTAISQCVSCQDNFIDLDAYASAIGQFDTATGHASFAMGYKSKAIGFASGAFGFNSEAHAAASFALGRMIKASATQSIVLGSGYMPSDYLINYNDNTLMIGFNSTAPTFFISRSPSNSQQKNRTGKIGIGNVTEPEAKLHIRADDNENAELYLQSHLWNSASIANIFIGNKNYGVEANDRLGLVFNSENNYVFGNGNVGIATTDPLHALHVNGNIMLSGNSSSLLFAADAKGEWGEWGIEYQNGGLNFWKPFGSNHFGNYFLFLSDEGNVGIGTELPEEKLDVRGTILTNGFKMPQLGMDDGYVLTADRNGNSAWMPSQSLWEKGIGDNIYRQTGNVGIGTSEPEAKLHVAGNFIVDNNIIGHRDSYQPLRILANTNDIDGAYITLAGIYDQKGSIKLLARGSEGRIEFNNNTRIIMSIREDNNVYFGDPDNSTNLFVNGEVNTKLVRVAVGEWYDNVLTPDYQLRSLYELEEYIHANNHLPDIPSEQQVKEEGIDVGEMNALLLKKIEELTLYLIDLKKENDEIKEMINNIK